MKKETKVEFAIKMLTYNIDDVARKEASQVLVEHLKNLSE